MPVRVTKPGVVVHAANDRIVAFTSSGAQDWLKNNALPLILVIIGIGIMASANKKDHKGSVTKVAIVLVGLVVVGLGIGGKATGVASFLSDLVFGG